MRIIAGAFKGRRILSPPGMKIRPTSDRARETLFSVLGEDVSGSSFLDVFAGTGAVGLEALSRGAAEAVFVEKDKRAASTLAGNIQRLAVSESCRLIISDWLKACRRLKRERMVFEFVFADPPYGESLAGIFLSSDFIADIIHQRGMLIIEHRRGESLPAPPEGLVGIREIVSGEAAFSLYKKEG
jgi:16S rRNA (guanine966-N2)-methyltransferase